MTRFVVAMAAAYMERFGQAPTVAMMVEWRKLEREMERQL